MYQPYSRYSNGNGYQHQQHPQQYQHEYQEYVPMPHQAQGPPVPYQQPSNPFMAPLAPTPPLLAQSKKGKKKKPHADLPSRAHLYSTCSSHSTSPDRNYGLQPASFKPARA